MDLQFEFLADHPDLVPLVIEWWHTVWGDRMGSDFDRLSAQLSATLSKESPPIHLMATLNGQAVGTAALKLHELEELFPDKQYWLGSVFVVEARRGANIACCLALQIVELARKMELPHLYLQTINLSGGLYANLGWAPIKQFRFKDEEILLMKKVL